MPERMTLNPWKSMWIRPRETIREVVDVDPKQNFWALAGIYGFPLMIQIMQNASVGQSLNNYIIFIISLVLSFVAGYIGISITSLFMLWTGRWIKGKATYLEMRAAVSWSNITNLVRIVTLLILMGVFGREMFFVSFPEMIFTKPQFYLVIVMTIIQFAAAIWSLVLYFISVSEVQRFSVWKAVLNTIFAFVILIILIWFIGTIVSWSTTTTPE